MTNKSNKIEIEKSKNNYEYNAINNIKESLSKDIEHLKESIDDLRKDSLLPIQSISTKTEQLMLDTKAIYGMMKNPSKQGKRIEIDLEIIFSLRKCVFIYKQLIIIIERSIKGI